MNVFDIISKDLYKLQYLIAFHACQEDCFFYIEKYFKTLDKYGVSDFEFDTYMMHKIDTSWVSDAN
jgi:hypothetical protein